MSVHFLGSDGRMNIVVAQAAVAPVANTLNGQGWRQAGELGVALLLSAAIGLEREIRGWPATSGAPMSERPGP
jgi:membrane-bound lytic murein transglycosylase B